VKGTIAKTSVALKSVVIVLSLAVFPALAQSDTNRFRALVLAECGDQHESYVVAALKWLKATAERDRFSRIFARQRPGLS